MLLMGRGVRVVTKSCGAALEVLLNVVADRCCCWSSGTVNEAGGGHTRGCVWGNRFLV